MFEYIAFTRENSSATQSADKKGIIATLLCDRCNRTMAARQDCIGRKGENLSEVVFIGVRVRDHPSTHGRRKKRVAHNRERPGKASDIKRCPALGVSPREKGFDRKWPEMEVRLLRKCLCSRKVNGFALGS